MVKGGEGLLLEQVKNLSISESKVFVALQSESQVERHGRVLLPRNIHVADDWVGHAQAVQRGRAQVVELQLVMYPFPTAVVVWQCMYVCMYE